MGEGGCVVAVPFAASWLLPFIVRLNVITHAVVMNYNTARLARSSIQFRSALFLTLVCIIRLKHELPLAQTI